MSIGDHVLLLEEVVGGNSGRALHPGGAGALLQVVAALVRVRHRGWVSRLGRRGRLLLKN